MVKRRKAEAAQDIALERPVKDTVWERRVQLRQQSIRDAYLAHAAELGAGGPEDRRLARDLRAFVAGMPVPLNRRQATTTELRRVREQWRKDREAPRPDPARNDGPRPSPPSEGRSTAWNPGEIAGRNAKSA